MPNARQLTGHGKMFPARVVAWLFVAALIIASWLVHRAVALGPPRAVLVQAEQGAGDRKVRPAAMSDQRAADKPATPPTRAELATELALRLQESARCDDWSGPSIRPSADVRKLLELVTQLDPAMALDLVNSAAGDSALRCKLAAIVARQWASVDVAAAWTWARDAGRGWDVPDYPPLLAAVCDGAAGQPAMLRELADEAIRRGSAADPGFDLARVVVAALLNHGEYEVAREAVVQWAAEVPAACSSGLIVAVASDMAHRSPSDAAAWLAQFRDSAQRSAGAAAVAVTWAGTAPEAALEWASHLPPEEGRDHATEMAFQTWQNRDAAAALSWLGKRADSMPVDGLVADLIAAPTFRADNPESAVQLAELVHDDQKRVPLLKSALLAWASQNRRAAQDYVIRSAMTDVQKADVLAAFEHYADFGFH